MTQLGSLNQQNLHAAIFFTRKMKRSWKPCSIRKWNHILACFLTASPKIHLTITTIRWMEDIRLLHWVWRLFVHRFTFFKSTRYDWNNWNETQKKTPATSSQSLETLEENIFEPNWSCLSAFTELVFFYPKTGGRRKRKLLIE